MDLNFTVQNLDADRASNRINRQDHAPQRCWHRRCYVDERKRPTPDFLKPCLTSEVQARDTAVEMVRFMFVAT